MSKWAHQKHLPRRQRATCQNSCPIGVSGCERRVSPKVVHLIKLDREVGENAVQVRPPATVSVVAVIAAFHRARERDGLYVFVHQRQASVQVVPVESGEVSGSQFNVLLRHRPRSIPQAQESA